MMTTVLQKTLDLPVQIRRQILHGVQMNPTARVEQILVHIVLQVNKPHYFVPLTFKNHTEVILSNSGPRSLQIKVVLRGDLGYVNLVYTMRRTIQTKKQVLRFYHNLLMHYELPIGGFHRGRDVDPISPLQTMVAKKFIRSSLEDRSPARWLRAAITTIDVHHRNDIS